MPGAKAYRHECGREKSVVNLPVIDGWEATRRIKSDEATRHIPVIALTAHAMSGSREKALAAGCDEFDTKPIQFDRLMQKINSVLANKPNKPAAR